MGLATAGKELRTATLEPAHASMKLATADNIFATAKPGLATASTELRTAGIILATARGTDPPPQCQAHSQVNFKRRAEKVRLLKFCSATTCESACHSPRTVPGDTFVPRTDKQTEKASLL